MAYPYGAYPGYMPGYYAPNAAMPDQLAQLRAAQQLPQMQPQIPAQTPSGGQGNGVIWVQGEAGAKSYMVAPGNAVMLLDSESSTFYLKTVDASGMPSMRIFDYTERSAQPVQAQTKMEYVTRSEFEALAARLDAMAAPSPKKAKEDQSNAESTV